MKLDLHDSKSLEVREGYEVTKDGGVRLIVEGSDGKTTTLRLTDMERRALKAAL